MVIITFIGLIANKLVYMLIAHDPHKNNTSHVTTVNSSDIIFCHMWSLMEQYGGEPKQLLFF